MKEASLTAERDDAGERTDKWLSRCLSELSRSRIQSLIKAGYVTVDGASVKANHKVTAGMTAEVRIPEAAGIAAEDLPVDVLYEDDDMIVINKRPGMVVHPAAGNLSGTLVNALMHRYGGLPGQDGSARPGIVHRLDKGTSGALVVARNDRSMAALSSQFKNRQVEKRYLALVWGRLDKLSGKVETLIGRSPRNRKKMAVVRASGREAVTNYEAIEFFRNVSLLRVRIETGRTHQIRVHLAHLGHPVVGDKAYGRSRRAVLPVPAERPMLHSERLVFRHPASGAASEFAAPLPEDMASLLEALRREEVDDAG